MEVTIKLRRLSRLLDGVRYTVWIASVGRKQAGGLSPVAALRKLAEGYGLT